MKTRLPRYLIVFAVLIAWFSFLPQPAQAENGEDSDARPVLSEMASDAGGIGGLFISFVSDRMEEIADQLSEAGRGLLEVPGLLQDLFVRAQDPETLIRWGEMGSKVVLTLAVGLLAAWIVRRFLRRPEQSLKDREEEHAWFRWLLHTGRTLIGIVPIGAFAVAAYGVLPLTDPVFETRLIALSLVNAGVFVGIVLVAARMICAPGISLPGLPIADPETGHYLYIWIRRVVILGVYGYFILEASLLMGMPYAVYAFLIKILGLIITVFLVALILQNKKDVAGWLKRGEREPEKKPEIPDEDKTKRPGLSAVGAFLNRLADGWHIIAVVFVIGFYGTWALEIEGGMRFLVTGIVMTLVVIVLAAILVRLVHHGVERLFHIRDDVKAAYPGLEERANRYQPFVRSVLSGVVYVISAFAILEAWGPGTLGWLFSPVGGLVVAELVTIVLIIGGAFLLWEVVNIFIERSLAREAAAGDAAGTRKLTLLPLLKNVVRISLVLIVSMLVLSQLGINIGPLLAGAGVIGLAIGFGAQALVRDVITGAFILMENAVSVGDWVEAGGHSGTVESLTIRTITLRDLAGTVHVIPFGDVTTVTNYNRDYGYALIDAGVAYRENYGDVVQALQDVAAELRRDEDWGHYITGDLEVFGMNNLGDSSVEIRVRIKTLPMRQFGVRRAFLERMKYTFDERGIEIPFPHRRVWFGVAKDGTAPPMRLAMDDQEAREVGGDTPAPSRARIQVASESDASRDVVEEAEKGDSETSDERKDS